MESKNNLGCGKEININNKTFGFICGVANAWGEEKFCPKCMIKLRRKWKEEDKLKLMKGGSN
tara:strand:- start:657 stop:842 length:186 start_codon:yes stop_codon:yes gene_type:complete